MRNNNFITYALYGMIGLLIVIAGYKACEMKAKEAEQAEKNKQLDETLDYYGFLDDSTSTESTFDSSGTSAAVDGIEYDEPQPISRPEQPTVTKKEKVENKPTTTTTTSTADKQPVQPKVTTTKPSVTSQPQPPSNSGRYMVVTGAFRSIANARDEMEGLVKSGYLNAEVRSLAQGYHHAIAFRSNSKSAAQQKANELRSKGFPEAYVKAAY
jgi:cell division septation protein DedD